MCSCSVWDTAARGIDGGSRRAGGANPVTGAVVVFLAVEATVELTTAFDTLWDSTAAVASAGYVGASLFAAAAMTWALATLLAVDLFVVRSGAGRRGRRERTVRPVGAARPLGPDSSPRVSA
jgi:hypothetical protein